MSTRRNKGEGSITILTNGKVRVRVELPPSNGKRRWLSATADTKKEALKKLKEMQRAKDDNKQVEGLRNTFGDYVEPYLTARREDGIRETSIQQIRNILNVAAEHFSYLPISEITTQHTNQLYAYYADKGNTEATIQHKMNIIKMMFEWLRFRGFVSTIPFSTFRKKISSRSNSKQHLEVLSLEEHKKLKDIMLYQFEMFLVEYRWNLSYRFYPLYLLAYETGMREGELAGLKWKYVDFDKQTVTIEEATVFLKGLGSVSSVPKTNSGYRTIKVSKDTIEVLRTLKKRYDDTHFISAYVFGNRKNGGKSYAPARLLGAFKQFLEDVGINRKFTFHDLRHTNASIMFHKNVDTNIIKERLGHSSITTTLTTYTHVLQECKDKNAAVVTA